MPYTKIKKITQGLRNRHFLVIDVFIMLITPFLALFLRLDGQIDFEKYGTGLIYSTIIFAIIKLGLFYSLNLYRSYWKTASIDELARLAFIGINVVLIQSMLFIILRTFQSLPFNNLPFSFPFVEGILSMLIVSSSRFSVRFFDRITQRKIQPYDENSYVIILGAGESGAAVVEELQRNDKLALTPVAFLDDDIEKLNLRIRGIPVIGKIDLLPKVYKRFHIKKVIMAMPTASGRRIRKILDLTSQYGIDVLTVPGVDEILSGKVNITKLRKIQVEDLLRRKPINTDINEVNKFLYNKKVFISGGGGSIGGELCRQILDRSPSQIVIIGHGENSVFEITQELNVLKNKKNGLSPFRTEIISRIADIKDKLRIEKIINEFKPDVIFHAAAHKHVPLMEENPSEVITNNLLGTKNLVEASIKFGINNFVLISSDKAVNSTNLMGVSKRVAEMITLQAAKKYNLNYKSVRFGNVLGSRGSVLHTFRHQLERGESITLTHPDIKRYFMTIPEAVQLVLQASVLGRGGEIFVLDMGEPVKIIDLARDVIRLAGLEEGVDVDIKITGLRPGEKMFEELFGDGEEYLKTSHSKIMVAKNSSEFIPNNLDEKLEYMIENYNSLDKKEIINCFKEIVPEFNHIN